jgi:hypothetical protein
MAGPPAIRIEIPVASRIYVRDTPISTAAFTCVRMQGSQRCATETATVATFPGFTPGAQYSRNLNGSTSPHELTRESRLPDCHARGVTCGNHRSDDFTDESLRHNHCFVSLIQDKLICSTGYAHQIISFYSGCTCNLNSPIENDLSGCVNP